MLQKYHPLWMSVHVNHPRELTAGGQGRARTPRQRGHSAGQPERAAARRQRRRRDDAGARAQAPALPRAALLPVPARPDPGFVAPAGAGVEGLGDHRRACAATRPATPCRSTSSTPPAAAARCRSTRITCIYHDKEKVVIRNYEGKVFEYPEPAERRNNRRGGWLDSSSNPAPGFSTGTTGCTRAKSSRRSATPRRATWCRSRTARTVCSAARSTTRVSQIVARRFSRRRQDLDADFFRRRIGAGHRIPAAARGRSAAVPAGLERERRAARRRRGPLRRLSRRPDAHPGDGPAEGAARRRPWWRCCRPAR